jgi:hypothetical protein
MGKRARGTVKEAIRFGSFPFSPFPLFPVSAPPVSLLESNIVDHHGSLLDCALVAKHTDRDGS